MTSKFEVICLVIACFLSSANVVARSLPMGSGDISSPECSDAFRLAKSMFNSRSSRVYAPLNIPDGMHSEMVLGTSALDISGGNALEANEKQFERVPQLAGYAATRSVYWGRTTEHGIRIVVKETPVGWRGDMYSLYLLDSTVSQIDFLKDAQGNNGKSRYSALVQNTWRPPLVFLSKSKKTWFIVLGEPYQVLANWDVYKESSGRYKRACVVKFRPEGASSMSPLPKAVQHFAQLLDETIGPGRDEGTLQSTARLRIQIQHVWANAALRPWALSDSDTYNSTEEVKAGLIEWSKNGPSYRRVYKEILRTYPLAEQALAGYYSRKFHLPMSKANSLANWVFDIAFRANYAFSNGQDYFRYDNVDTNPWRNNLKH